MSTLNSEEARKQAMQTRLFKRYQGFAERFNGQLLAFDGKDSSVRGLWQCEKGHQFKKLPRLVKAGKWCPYCYFQLKNKDVLDGLKEKIISQGAKCDEIEEITSFTMPLHITCKYDHAFKTNAHLMLKRGDWCKRCKKAKHTINDVIDMALAKGGRYIGDDIFVTSHVKLNFICGRGHECQLTLEGLLKGRWCQVCKRMDNRLCCKSWFRI